MSWIDIGVGALAYAAIVAAYLFGATVGSHRGYDRGYHAGYTSASLQSMRIGRTNGYGLHTTNGRHAQGGAMTNTTIPAAAGEISIEAGASHTIRQPQVIRYPITDRIGVWVDTIDQHALVNLRLTRTAALRLADRLIKESS